MTEDADRLSDVTDADVVDPLTPVTRRERTGLLAANVLLFAAAQAGLIPKEIDAFGIKATAFDTSALFFLLFTSVGYYSLGFVIYSIADLRAWKTRMFDLRTRLETRAKFYAEKAIAEGIAEARETYVKALPPEALDQFAQDLERRLRAYATPEGRDRGWKAYNLPYRARTLFDIAAPLILTVVNIGAAIWRIAR